MSAPRDAVGPSPGGRIPFRVAIVTLVVGLLFVTCGVLIPYVFHRGQQSVEVLKRDYLQQVAETTVREVARLPLSPAALRGAGYFDPEVVTGWLRAHRAGHRRFEARLMRVLSVQLLDDIFVRGRRRHAAMERSPSPAPPR